MTTAENQVVAAVAQLAANLTGSVIVIRRQRLEALAVPADAATRAKRRIQLRRQPVHPCSSGCRHAGTTATCSDSDVQADLRVDASHRLAPGTPPTSCGPLR